MLWGGSTAEATYNINGGPDALALSSIAAAAASSFLSLSPSLFLVILISSVFQYGDF